MTFIYINWVIFCKLWIVQVNSELTYLLIVLKHIRNLHSSFTEQSTSVPRTKLVLTEGELKA